ncbi:HAD family hydrolase [Bryocella elongata]|uniref:HAD family hydrolase n=1 Tax=Bryocella elongata TaxID=863522 RepID=UPI001F1D519B|nr:haloacid dehalogenase-like hydrolase [Bryocella elongata]
MSEHAASSLIASGQPKVLSTVDFLQNVHALKPRLAVFDCDGTLWSGDAGSTFMWWTMENGLLSAEKTAWLKGRYDGYNAGQVSELAICGEMVQVYEGIPVAEMRRAAATFFAERIEKNIFPEMAGLLADLQRTGVEIWAVSSTCDWVIEEGVKRFGIPPERVLAACVETEGEGNAAIATSRLIDVPTDAGKVASLKRMGITAPDVVFGNSVHDYAMLAIARGPFPVNPSAELQRRSAESGWSVFWPDSVKPSL